MKIRDYDLIQGFLTEPLDSPPDTPPTGYARVYFKSNNELYYMLDNGVEMPLSSGGGTAGIDIEKDGVIYSTGVPTLNFTGGNISLSSGLGGTVNIAVSEGTAGVSVENDGVSVGSGFTVLNFDGTAISDINDDGSGQVTVTIDKGIQVSDSVGVAGTFTALEFSNEFDVDVSGFINFIGDFVPSSRTVTAGTALGGGGALSGNITINLEDTLVTPGVYTLATITVDQQGRITAASSGTAGSGDVVGPAAATSSALARFDGTTGKLIKNSATLLDDGGNLVLSGGLTAGGNVAGLNLSGTNTGDQLVFKTIAVAGQSDIVAETATDTLTLAAGSNISITTNASTDTVTIGVTGMATGDVVGPASATDNALARFDSTTGKLIQNSNATLNDSGDLTVVGTVSASNLSGSSSGTNTGDQLTFKTVSVSGQSDIVADSLTDTLTLAAGANISITTNATTDTVTIGVTGMATGDVVGPASSTTGAVARYNGTTGKILLDSATLLDDSGNLTLGGALTAALNVSGANLSGTNTGDQLVFKTISVAGQSDIVADSITDTLTLAAGTNVSITTNAATDTITIGVTGVGTGDVVGPGSSTDNALARFDSTTGKLIQNSNATLSDTGDLVVVGTIGSSNVSGTNTGDQLTFKTISVSGQSDIVADTITDTLTFAAGANVSITTNATTDTITIGVTGLGSGDVVGPASATDNAIARFDTTTGKLIQDSAVTIDDSGNLAATGGVTASLIGCGYVGVLTAGTAAAVVMQTGTYTGTVSMDHGTQVLNILSQVTSGGAYKPIQFNNSMTLSAAGALAVTGAIGASNLSGTNTGDQLTFKTIAVSGQSDIVADSITDTLTIVAGANITLTTNAATDTLTIAAASGGTGDVVGPGSATDNALARFDATTGKLIQNSNATLSDAGDLVVVGTVGASNLSGTNTGDQLTFKTVAVSGQSDIVADSSTDTLTIAAGANITITTNATTDTLTIAASGGTGDVVGPASSVNNNFALFNGTTGKLIKDSAYTMPTFGTAYQTLSVNSAGTNFAFADNSAVLTTITQSSHGFVAKDVVRYNGTTWVKAQANAHLSCRNCWIVISSTTNTFIACKAGRVTLTGHGLTTNTVYYLSAATAGLLTSTRPVGTLTTPLGFYAVMLYVEDANTLSIMCEGPTFDRILAQQVGTPASTTMTFSNLDFTLYGYNLKYEVCVNSGSGSVEVIDVRVNSDTSDYAWIQAYYNPTAPSPYGYTNDTADGAFTCGRKNSGTSAGTKMYASGEIIHYPTAAIVGFTSRFSFLTDSVTNGVFGNVTGRWDNGGVAFTPTSLNFILNVATTQMPTNESYVRLILDKPLWS